MKKLSPEVIQAVINDVAVRKALVHQSHEAFCRIYLGRHITCEFAWFHKEMFRITEKYQHKLNVFMAFRGSGKSTILNLSNALWSILGKHQKKFVLVVSKTKLQSQSHFDNIKQELEENELLKNDLGPFQASKEDWGAYMIEIPKYGAKIMCIGANQNIRGLKYRNHRPDLIICDDIEDMNSFQDKNEIESLHNWFMNELWSIGDETTNIVVLGNLLNKSSLLITLYKAIRKKEMAGIFKAYPLLDDCNHILWPARYPTVESIKEIENSLPKPNRYEMYTVFCREYLLDMSSVRGDPEMTEKHQRPITVGGKRAKDFEISVPLWGTGILMDIPLKKMVWASVDDSEGYPRVEIYRKIQDEYDRIEREKNPEKFILKKNIPEHNDSYSFTNSPDRPSRYMV
jgi:hypothetical protein